MTGAHTSHSIGSKFAHDLGGHDPISELPTFQEPPAFRWFWRGQIGLSQVFSDVGGQMQPMGCGAGGCIQFGGKLIWGGFGSQIGQPAAVR
jgi:hypothetical protein